MISVAGLMWASARVSKSWDWGLSINDELYARLDVKDDQYGDRPRRLPVRSTSNNAFADPNFAAYGFVDLSDQGSVEIQVSISIVHFSANNKTRFSLFGRISFPGRPYSLTLNDETNRSAVFGSW